MWYKITNGVQNNLNMKTIKYIKVANNSYKGNGWTGFESLHFNSTLIFTTLWAVIRRHSSETFELLCERVKEAYKNKVVKSNCNITIYNGVLEISKKNKTLPEIWVLTDIEK